MTDEEKQRVGELLKTAWQAGFKSARHYPNHSLPVIYVHWDGTTPTLDVNWSQRKPGYIG